MLIHRFWFFFGYASTCSSSRSRDHHPGARLPAGLYMAAQGSLTVFMVMLSMLQGSRTRSIAIRRRRRRLRRDRSCTTAGPSDFLRTSKMHGTTPAVSLADRLLAILEPGRRPMILGYLFVFFTLAVYAVIGVMTRTAQFQYYVAGRRCRVLRRHGDRRRSTSRPP